MSTSFNPRIAVKAPNRNKFNLSYYSRLTSRMGDLVPVLCKKIVPSDEFKVSISAITRLAPLANPVYDRLRIDYDAFFVQNRIIDPQFKEFLTGGIGLYGETSTEGMRNIVFSYLPGAKSTRKGLLMDYLGFHFSFSDTSANDPVITLNAEPVLGYYKIYSDWYRNERFQPDAYKNVIDSLITSTREITLQSPELFHRNYFKDPYTTALAEPLIGGPIPIMNGQVPVQSYDSITDSNIKTSSDSTLRVLASENSQSLFVDLANVASNTVQQLNQMYALYKFFMRDTYNGNRYVEFVQSHFNVTVPDSTLERPLFLGRYTQNVAFSEIFQTSGSTGTNNTLGDYSGKGASVGNGFLFHEKFLEHGYLYIIMSIVPDSTYFQGASSIFAVGDRFESFYFPEFQNIGDVAIDSRTIFGFFAPNSIYQYKDISDHTFGFQRRNWDMIWYPNELHGDFIGRENMLNWTFARTFDDVPILGSDFSQVQQISNPFIYTAEDGLNFFTDIYFDIQALRPVERYESITTH